MVWQHGIGIGMATLLGVGLLAGTVSADVAIKPAFVEVTLDEGRPAGTFLVSNVGTKEERFRVNALHFTYDEQGGLKKSPTGKYSLASWIRFNPRELTLAPGTQRAVRFAIIPKGKLVEGEYWAGMELESLAVNEVVSKDQKSGRSVKLKLMSTIIAPIFATMGKTSYGGEIRDIQAKVENGAIVLKALVAATGNGRIQVKGDYQVMDASGKEIDRGAIGAGYVFREGQRWFSKNIQTSIPTGEYTVRVSIEATHLEQPLVKEAKVAWPALPPVAAGANPQPTAPSAPAKSQDQSPNPKDGTKQTEIQGSAGTK